MEMEDLSYLFECRISEDVERKLKRVHDGGHEDDVLDDFIVPDKIARESSTNKLTVITMTSFCLKTSSRRPREAVLRIVTRKW